MLRLAAVLTLLPMLASPAPQTMETREYDLRIPTLYIEPPPLGLVIQQETDTEEELVHPYHDPAEAIRGLLGDKTWEEDQAAINCEDGILTVTHRPAVHDVVAAAVRHLRYAAARPVRVDAHLIEMEPAAYAAWRGNDSGPVLAEAQSKALSAALTEGRARTLKEFSSRITEGQPAVLQDLEQRTYVNDLEPNIAEGSTIDDLTVALMQVGDAWTLTASGLPGREELRLDFSMRRFDLLTEEEFQPIDKGPSIVLPSGRRQEHHQTIIAPSGRAVLAAAWQVEGKSRLLTIRARLLPAGDSGPVTGPSGIVLTAFPLQAIHQSMLSRRAPDVRSQSEVFTGPKAVVDNDEEIDVRADRLLERVREAIGGWDLPGSAFTTDESQIALVRHDKDRTAAAGRHLARAVEPHFRMVTIEARVLALDGIHLARLKSAEPPPTEVVRDPALAAAAAEFTVVEGQTGYVADLGVRTYVADFDTQVANRAAAHDPVPAEAMDGLQVEACAAGAEGGRLSLNLKAWLAQMELAPRTLKRGEAPELRAHSMRRQEFRVPVSMSVKEGEWTIAGLTSRKKGAETVHLALVVRATRGK